MQIPPRFCFARLLISFLCAGVLTFGAVAQTAREKDKDRGIEHLAALIADSLATNKVNKILMLDFAAADDSLKDATKFLTKRIALTLEDQKHGFKVVEQQNLTT